ncbi:MAG TPA: hypothetical protein P5164_19215 [Thermoanaerobaculia bacterium]|nr:hypothetical protein [Thermoanaerobaculia bacterium]
MKGSARAAAVGVAILAAAAVLASRGRLRELGLRARLAFLAIVTLLGASLLVRGLAADGDRRLYALVAFAVVAPCVVLAWRDLLRRR